ncbi:hypothetical protein CMUS01_14720 [Colletotrichum musicola]|uniref:Uncharacterized protein n=1 Tax=Colletotrichum musicola TaxID=2175873 RepID=A0A8H6J2W1_9PEZI|nr:hypothetical protein CMUS01_14720 [Colletotrichum musicola]
MLSFQHASPQRSTAPVFTGHPSAFRHVINHGRAFSSKHCCSDPSPFAVSVDTPSSQTQTSKAIASRHCGHWERSLSVCSDHGAPAHADERTEPASRYHVFAATPLANGLGEQWYSTSGAGGFATDNSGGQPGTESRTAWALLSKRSQSQRDALAPHWFAHGMASLGIASHRIASHRFAWHGGGGIPTNPEEGPSQNLFRPMAWHEGPSPHQHQVDMFPPTRSGAKPNFRVESRDLGIQPSGMEA